MNLRIRTGKFRPGLAIPVPALSPHPCGEREPEPCGASGSRGERRQGALSSRLLRIVGGSRHQLGINVSTLGSRRIRGASLALVVVLNKRVTARQDASPLPALSHSATDLRTAAAHPGIPSASHRASRGTTRPRKGHDPPRSASCENNCSARAGTRARICPSRSRRARQHMICSRRGRDRDLFHIVQGLGHDTGTELTIRNKA